MSPLRPTEPLPHLTGLGTHVHLDTTLNAADPIGDYRPIRPTMPGYEVPLPRPDGARVWLLDEEITVAELPDGTGYEITAADLATPVRLDPDEVYRAGHAIANLVKARLHDARQTQAARVELAILDDPVDSIVAGLVYQALRGVA